MLRWRWRLCSPDRARIASAPAAIVLAVSLAAVLAWTVRNYIQSGEATFSSVSSKNLLLFRAAGTLAIRDPGGHRRQPSSAGKRSSNWRRAMLWKRDSTGHASRCRSRERATMYGGLAMPIIFGDPGGTAMQAGTRLRDDPVRRRRQHAGER